MAKCTNLTYLMIKVDDDFEKLINITEYPDLGGEKEKLDTTTLSDTKKRNIDGIEDVADMVFKAWYEKEDYKKLLALEGKLKTFRIYFGVDGVDGVWEWEGRLSVYPNGGSVNAVREMQFAITDEGEEALQFINE